MSIRLNSINLNTTNFRGEVSSNATPAVQMKDLNQPAADELTKSNKKEKTGFVQSFKNGVAAVRKFFAILGEYTKGTFIGVLQGVTLGTATYLGLSLAGLIKKKQPHKAIKVVTAVLAGAIPFANSLYKSSLNVSDRKAGIDHKYNTGHNK